jgi:hypothetical protein
VFAFIPELEDWKKTQEELAARPSNHDGADVESGSGGEGPQLPSEMPLDQISVRPEVTGTSGTDPAFSTRRPFAGHRIHILLSATLVAVMFATTVMMELAYVYDRYRAVIWRAAPFVLLWTVACVFLAAAIDWNCQRRGNPHGLWLASLTLAAGAAINFLTVRPLLPSWPVTQASFQTWTAQAAYLKGVVYCAAFSAFFVLVPFNFVVAMQRELRRGMHNLVFGLLTRNKTAVAPPGAPFLPAWVLWSMLVFGAIYSLVSTAHLLEALKLTPYTNLFILTIQIRWVLFLLLGVECCWWYYAALEQLKRECVAVGCGTVKPGASDQTHE